MSKNATITTDYNVEEVSNNLGSFQFNNSISLNDFKNLIDVISPDLMRVLKYNGILEQVSEELPLELVQALVSTGIGYDIIINNSKFSNDTLDYIIENHLDEIEIINVIGRCNITFDQFKYLVHNKKKIPIRELAETIGDKKNLEYAMYIAQNWHDIKGINADYISVFRNEIFTNFGSMILSDSESRQLFGMASRPTMSTEELRDYSPCPEGWKRVLKWSPRNNHKYTWNEFVARHILANMDELEEATNDLVWLAANASEGHGYFE